MDTKENTVMQELQSQVENWSWRLVKNCSKNWAEDFALSGRSGKGRPGERPTEFCRVSYH